MMWYVIYEKGIKVASHNVLKDMDNPLIISSHRTQKKARIEAWKSYLNSIEAQNERLKLLNSVE